ncbi:MAG: mechanosensitive ion channel [Desulfamplus sp.]|nr:mechanosensitive ion channel [Desulfamplus sp.]
MIQTPWKFQVIKKHLSFQILLTGMLFFLAGSIRAETPAGSEMDMKKIEDQITLIAKTLEIEEKEAANLEARLEAHRNTKNDFDAKINIYRIEATTIESRLHLPDMDMRLLERAYMGCQASMTTISTELSKLKQHNEQLRESQRIAYEQKLINDNLLTEFSVVPLDTPPIVTLHGKLKKLQTHLTAKMLLMQSLDGILNDKIDILENISSKYKTLMEYLESRIKNAKKTDLLTRKQNPLAQATWDHMGRDIIELLGVLGSVFQGDHWKNSFSFMWVSGIHKLAAFSFTFFIIVIVSLRIRSLITRILSSPFIGDRYWSALALKIIRTHFILFMVTAYLYLCINLGLFFNYAVTANIIVELLMIVTFILWLIQFIETIEIRFPGIPANEIVFFLKAMTIFAMVHIILGYMVGSDSSVIITYRLFCECLFYGWILYFLKRLLPFIEDRCKEGNRAVQVIPEAVKNTITLIAVTGIVLEILGYGSLALYWYTSWGKTMIVLMWSGLIIGASREWIPGSVAKIEDQGEDISQDQGRPGGKISILWLVKQFCFFMLFFMSSIALSLSWASSDYLFPRLFIILTYSFEVGSMGFSLAGLFKAGFILILTHYAARGWRHFFHKNFLGESGLDRGVQESMTTITVYSIWIFGIFVSMIVFGLDATTLTVAFGALGIGMGFGLQNIFNNFVSGIILLFERPIQVGDDIEINGTWATIRKTNVRSTVAQTYDNATIMIPNSELISNQVINWSFKDKRLRRKIRVHVAHGSDIDLVRDTLLGIARKTPKVLSYPEPDVLFSDFGESSLIFILRVWTFIDFFLIVETDIRSQIYKIFQERGIVIAYPQHDIHIKE